MIWICHFPLFCITWIQILDSEKLRAYGDSSYSNSIATTKNSSNWDAIKASFPHNETVYNCLTNQENKLKNKNQQSENDGVLTELNKLSVFGVEGSGHHLLRSLCIEEPSGKVRNDCFDWGHSFPY